MKESMQDASGCIIIYTTLLITLGTVVFRLLVRIGNFCVSVKIPLQSWLT